jgi:hypothetical protein
MKLAIRPLALTCGILGGLTALLLGLANMWWTPYGDAALGLLASIYPGYSPDGSFGSVLNVTLYATVDSAICGLVFGWLYNMVVRMQKDKK